MAFHRPHAVVLAVLSAVLSAPRTWPAQERDAVEAEKSSDAAEARAKDGEARIAQEAASLRDHAWAGSYYRGDGLGVNVSLSLAPRAGFVFEWHGCLGLYDRNFGSVVQEGDRLRLVPELANTHDGFEGIDEELIPVAWGPRRYLIALEQVSDFCNAVNDGSEARSGIHGLFLLREGDENKKARGAPGLPVDLAGCLLERPIRARVIAVGSTTLEAGGGFTTRKTTVTLDVGRTAGAWPDMQLHVQQPDQPFTTVRVKVVDESTSQAEVEQWLSDRAPEEAPPAVGWRLTTRR